MTAESPNGSFSRGFSTTLGCADELHRSASSPDPCGACENVTEQIRWPHWLRENIEEQIDTLR